MIMQWFDFFKYMIEDVIDFLSTCSIPLVGSLATIIVTAMVSTILVKSFLSRGAS